MNRGLTICQLIAELLGYSRASLHEVGQHFDAGLVKGQTGTIIDEMPKIRATLVGGGAFMCVKKLDRSFADLPATSHCLGGDAWIGWRGEPR